MQQLQQRLQALQGSASTGDSHQAWTEYLDIVRWLPELAGDSDLQRADWELVQRVSQDLERRLQPLAKDAHIPPEVAHSCQVLLAELETLIGRSTTSIPGPSPH